MFWTLPTTSPRFTRDEFIGTNTTAWQQWISWQKPVGKSMIQILLIWAGGWGGSWVVGANSTAAGGWWWWSGWQTRVLMPLALLPDTLYISLAGAKTGSWVASYVSVFPNTTANHTVAIANGWGAWGNASGATAGAAGAAGAIATAWTMPIWFNFATVLAWQAGIIGWVAVAGANLTLPVTGLLVTGWTGGGGLPAAAAVGTNWGAFTVPASPTIFMAQPAGIWGSAATTPPTNWSDWFWNFAMWLTYWYWGTWGGSTHWSATTTGLVQASWGNGAIGCGGGWMGGALTGSSAWALSRGWPWFCQIICF